MGRNLLKRIIGLTSVEPEDDLLDEEENTADEDHEPMTKTHTRQTLASLQVSFYGESRATVEMAIVAPEVNAVHPGFLQLRLVLDYYAETLYQLGVSEAGQQLQQYIGALCMHLVEEGELKRINILGSLLELLYQTPENDPILHQQKASLMQNPDGSRDTEFAEPLLPSEYYLPTSMLLLFQNMLYTLSDDRMAQLIMAISAMHTYYATRYSSSSAEGRRLAPRHAVQQVEQSLEQLLND